MITHYDLFAGIGGFSLALEEVFQDEPIRHIFCEWESFPTSVLRQHWPDGEFYGDIADLVAATNGKRMERGNRDKPLDQTNNRPCSSTGTTANNVTDTDSQRERHGLTKVQSPDGKVPKWHDNAEFSNTDRQFTIVTGGFPCQPFSHAGRRKGTADDRYQWPNMFEVIRNTSPDWVIAENVRGLVTWNDGLVLEQVCADLEAEGYEVQPLIIPAVAVGAPHRRDRVWIIANRSSTASRVVKSDTGRQVRQSTEAPQSKMVRPENRTLAAKGYQANSGTYADTGRKQRQQGVNESIRPETQEQRREERQYPDWSRNWQEVAFATCDDTVDDGLPRIVDGVPYSRAKWRKDSLKAYGNGIVPEVAMNIIKAIKETI